MAEEHDKISAGRALLAEQRGESVAKSDNKPPTKTDLKGAADKIAEGRARLRDGRGPEGAKTEAAKPDSADTKAEG